MGDDLLASYASSHASLYSTMSAALRSAPSVRMHSHTPAVMLQQPHRSHVPMLAPLNHQLHPPRHLSLKPFHDMMQPFAPAARKRPIALPPSTLPAGALPRQLSAATLSALETASSKSSLRFSPKADIVPVVENGAGLLVSGSVRMPSPFVGKHSTPIRGAPLKPRVTTASSQPCHLTVSPWTTSVSPKAVLAPLSPRRHPPCPRFRAALPRHVQLGRAQRRAGVLSIVVGTLRGAGCDKPTAGTPRSGPECGWPVR